MQASNCVLQLIIASAEEYILAYEGDLQTETVVDLFQHRIAVGLGIAGTVVGVIVTELVGNGSAGFLVEEVLTAHRPGFEVRFARGVTVVTGELVVTDVQRGALGGDAQLTQVSLDVITGVYVPACAFAAEVIQDAVETTDIVIDSGRR